MTVKELRQLLKGLPSDMVVMMPLDWEDEIIISVCAEKSGVVQAEENDSPEEILLLLPCGCNEGEESEEFAKAVQPDHPELN